MEKFLDILSWIVFWLGVVVISIGILGTVIAICADQPKFLIALAICFAFSWAWTRRVDIYFRKNRK
jgi:hypothetical protein